MSQQRRCDFVKAVDQQWYMTLGDFEHAYDDLDCTVHGPFPTHEQADQYLIDHFRNPGGSTVDSSGTAPVPSNAVRPHLGEEDDDLQTIWSSPAPSRSPRPGR